MAPNRFRRRWPTREETRMIFKRTFLSVTSLLIFLTISTADAKKYTVKTTHHKAGTVKYSISKVRTDHYSITTDIGATFATELALTMEAAHKSYSERFDALGLNRKSNHTVDVFSKRIGFEHFVGQALPNCCGAYILDRRALAAYLSVERYGEVLKTLRHEGFHQFVHFHVKYPIPLWINEGLALNFESFIRTDGNDFIPGDAPRWRVAYIRKAVKDGKVWSLKKLFSLTNKQWLENMRSRQKYTLQYNQSWSIVHFLFNTKDTKYRGRMVKYLRLFNKKTDFGTAFKKVFGRDIKAFDKAWRKYVIDDLRPSNRAIDISQMRPVSQLLGALAKKGKNVKTIERLYNAIRRGEVSLSVCRVSMNLDADKMFSSPEDPKVKAAIGKTLKRPILSYIVEPPVKGADPAWPTLRCTHYKDFDLVSRYRRIGKGKNAPIVLEALQTRKKITPKPSAKPTTNAK